MRLIRIALLALLACITTATLQASPHVIIHDPEGPATPVGLTFTFNANVFGGGIFTFTNASGINWYNLYVFTPAPSPTAPITCGGNVLDSFAFCQVQAGQGGYFSTVVFHGPPGIANGQTFFADIGDNGWTPSGQFRATANVPEPASLLLLASGVAGWVLRRRRRA